MQDRLPEAPAVKPELLGTLRTLRQIADFLADVPESPRAHLQVDCEGVSSETQAANPLEPAPDVASGRIARMSRAACGSALLARTGARLVEISPGSGIWLVGDGSPLADAIRHRLIDRGHEVRLIGPQESTPPEPGERVAALIILAPSGGQQSSFVKDVFRLIRAAGPSLRRHGAGAGAALVTVSRMDGAFGLNGLDVTIDPTSGALAGLLKTARHEWPEVHCKAIDLDATFRNVESAAERIVAEMFRRGPCEVGLTEVASNQVELVALPPAPLDRLQEFPLRAGELVVISGGGRGITAEVAPGPCHVVPTSLDPPGSNARAGGRTGMAGSAQDRRGDPACHSRPCRRPLLATAHERAAPAHPGPA